jgi:hypothetical protein
VPALDRRARRSCAFAPLRAAGVNMTARLARAAKILSPSTRGRARSTATDRCPRADERRRIKCTV